MSIVNSEIPEEGVLVEEMVTIPLALFEDLIRAKTERDVLEATIEGEDSFVVSEVLKSIQTARKKHLRGVVRSEIGVAPPTEPEPSDEDAMLQLTTRRIQMELMPASEGSMMFEEKQVALADRKQFVENLGWLLSQTREGVESAYLDDKDTVHVLFCKGGVLLVDVTCDSYMAIIRDVANVLR